MCQNTKTWLWILYITRNVSYLQSHLTCGNRDESRRRDEVFKHSLCQLQKEAQESLQIFVDMASRHPHESSST